MSHPSGVLLTQQFRTNPAQRQTNVRAACRHCSPVVLGWYSCISNSVFVEKFMEVKALGEGGGKQGELGQGGEEVGAMWGGWLGGGEGLGVVPWVCGGCGE